jgi:hypothetical protein
VTTRERLLVFCCLLFAGGLFVLGINWGLPSRAADEFLFGSRTPWTGAEILALAPIDEDPNRGADVDADPLAGRDNVLVLNQTDKQRAEIVRRYRLFTYQPDEYNTLKSLSGMNPGKLQLDPRMYQYGGLWIYPVGALLKISSLIGIIDLRNDKAYYLDHPEAFGRFYVIARLYSAAWGVVGAWAVYMLARKLTGRSTPAAAASACWAMMPVVVNMAHEAKPHLAGLSIMLLAVLAASRYVETGERRWWVLCGVACGAATGMVISCLVIFVLLPMILILRPLESGRERVRLAATFVGVGLLVYAVSNPYVFINLVRNPAVLRSNFGTSTAMYHATAAGVWLNGGKLMLEAATIAVVLFGVIGVLHVIESSVAQRRLNFYWPGCPAVHLLWLLVAAGLLVAVQFFLLAAGKPGEYGRFALLPATVLCILAVTSFWTFLPPARVAFLSTLLVCTAWFGTNYIAHFDADLDPMMTPRMMTADALRAMKRTPAKKLAIVAEPAPYSMPPVDLWHWELQLLPRGADPGAAARAADSDLLVRAVDQLPETVPAGFRRLERPLTQPLLANPARISWAAKPFEILVTEKLPMSDVVDLVEQAATEPSQTRPAP